MEPNPSKAMTAKPSNAEGYCGEPELLWPSCSGREGTSCHTCTGASHAFREKLSAGLSPGPVLPVASPAGHREGQSAPRAVFIKS